MPLHELPEERLRSHCRRTIETLERWLRNLVHETLLVAYGGGYLDAADASGVNVIRSSTRNGAHSRMTAEPGRYPRPVDAFLLDDVVDLIVNARHWPLFMPALAGAFPEGPQEARTFLYRVFEARNPLAHGNAISVRQAERVICYSNDVLESLKTYYTAKGSEVDYNVPSFIRVLDSLGNDLPADRLVTPEGGSFRTVDLRRKTRSLYPGEQLAIEAEVDASYSPSEYNVEWMWTFGRNHLSGPSRIVINLGETDVGETYGVIIRVVSHRDWHRHGTHDHQVNLMYRVLPPRDFA